jgi:nitrite reductase (NADH) small subunit
MPQWVKLCALNEAPAPNQVLETGIRDHEHDIAICLANLNGQLSALDNWCPHRQGPLGQGWIEGDAVICPWHSWAFNARTGLADYPENEKVATFPLRIEGDEVFIDIA